MANVLIGVTGGIAAYKAPGVIRRLRESGHEVKVVATEAAFRFIPEETLAIAAGGHVHTDETWWERSGRVEHVSLARWADLVLVAPATADAMARAAVGLGDGARTTFSVWHRGDTGDAVVARARAGLD